MAVNGRSALPVSRQEAAEDLVLDVRDVHDVRDVQAVEGEHAADEVREDEGAEVPDVPEVIDRGAAAVEPNARRGGGDEGLDGPGERVVQPKAHVLRGLRGGAWQVSRAKFPVPDR